MKQKTILYLIIFFVFAAIFVLFRPAKVETNIAKSLFSGIFTDTAEKLNLKYSNEINVLIEADDKENVDSAKTEFLKNYDTEVFKIRKFEPYDFLESYKKYNKNLLSNNTYQILKSEDFLDVTLTSYERLFDPLGVMTVSLNDDPYMLFSDFLKSLGGNKEEEVVKYNNKFYHIINLEISDSKNIKNNVLNSKIKELIASGESLENAKVYMSGIPISSYYENLKFSLEIKIFTLFSLLFIVLIFYLYFKNIKLLIPILMTSFFGIFAGYFVSDLFFGSIHIMTYIFVCAFLILSILFPIRYYIEKDRYKLLKNATLVYLVQVICFILLLFSGFSVVRQISLFMMTTITIIYLITVIVYPILPFRVVPHRINVNINNKIAKILIISVISIICIISYVIQFDDNIQHFYFPTQKLMQTQEFFRNISGTDIKTSFVVIKGKNLQDILEKEEEIISNLKSVEYQALSKYFPSVKRQKENFELRQKLYKYSIKNYATFLSDKNANNLISEKSSEDYLIPQEDLDILHEFIIDKNTSIIILYNFDNPMLIKSGKYINLQKDISLKIGKIRKIYEFGLLPYLLVIYSIFAYLYSPKQALKFLFPIIIGCIFSLGFLSLTGQKINVFHIISLFILISIGVEYSIYNYTGMKNTPDKMLLSYITGVFSSILLVASRFQPLSSIGMVLISGITAIYLINFLFDTESNISN